MSMDQLAPLVFGTASVLVIIVAFFFVVRYVRNHFFPSQASDKLDGAMLEMQILQAQLESRTADGQVSPGEDDGEDDGEIDVEGGDSSSEAPVGESDPPAAEESDPSERQE